jgi:DNA (cytosine-5)-methyltransferase 1
MKHKLLDLFSGIGGFSLGAEANGIPTVAFVEKDPFCQKVLRKHWSNTPIISDIRTVKGEDYETDGVTIVSGGFPCQPFSQAGKRKGTDDDRYLWDETLRVVTETKPRWFIGENVDGLVNIQDGMVLRSVQDDLEKEGFKVQCLVIPSSSIGAWHQRKRIWIIGENVSNTNDSRDRTSKHGTERQGNKTDDQGRQEQSQSKPSRHSQDVSNTIGELSDGCSSTTRLSPEKQEWMVSHSQEYKDKVWGETKRCNQQTGSRGDVSNTNGERLQGHGVQTNMEVEERQVSSIGSPQGQYTWWQTESKLRGVPHGISYELDKDRANRIKALGNSIVPQIAYQLFKSIVTVTKEDDHEQVYWC